MARWARYLTEVCQGDPGNIPVTSGARRESMVLCARVHDFISSQKNHIQGGRFASQTPRSRKPFRCFFGPSPQRLVDVFTQKKLRRIPLHDSCAYVRNLDNGGVLTTASLKSDSSSRGPVSHRLHIQPRRNASERSPCQLRNRSPPLEAKCRIP